MMDNITVIQDLPPYSAENELVGIDLEIYAIPDGKLHRPVGVFACASFFLERQLGSGPMEVYQIYDPDQLYEAVCRIERGRWVFQNAQFDLRQMRRWATIKPRPIWDTMIIDQGLWGGYYSKFDLASLSLRYLHEYMDKAVRDEFQTASEMTPEMMQYAALDPVITVRVAKAQMEYIQENDISLDHYWEADHPALWAILDMLPVKMNVDGWHNLSQEFKAKKEMVAAPYGDTINLGSTQQVNKRLCEMLHRKMPFKSTDEETLLGIKDKGVSPQVVTFIDDVLAYRGAAKASGTYGDNWLDKHIENGAVWAHWKPVQALTGRMACGDPNLQNIPSRDYPIFRSFFVASDGCVMVVGDVAQQEPRVLAKLSGDGSLTDALVRGISPHILVGQRVFGDPSFSKKDPRYVIAKQLNLGLSYGLTANGLATRAGIDVEDAEGHLNAYFRAFPGVKAYIDKYRQIAYRQGYVSTLLGRRSFINPYVRKWENNAINCLDAETEALTPRGWVKGFDLTSADYLLTKNKDTGKLEWKKIHYMNTYPDYEGPLVEFKSRSFSAVSTPNHRWLVTSKATGLATERTTEALSPWGDDRIHRTGNYDPTIYVPDIPPPLSPDQAELLGWFVTDGYLRKPSPNPKRLDRRRGPKAQIVQSQSGNPEKVARIDALVGRLGGSKRSTYKNGSYVVWTLSKELSALLISFAPGRVLTMDALLMMDRTRLLRLQEAMLLGDGNGRTDSTDFYAGTLEKAEIFQVLCTLTGSASVLAWKDTSHYIPVSPKMPNIPKSNGCWVVTILKRTTAQVTHTQRTEFVAKMPVWCPTVDNTFFVARRKGKVFITGNSPVQGSASDQMKMAMGFMHRESATRNLPFCLTMVIHDEMVCDVPVELEKDYTQLIKDAWDYAGQRTLGDTIPMVVEIASGPHWGCKGA